MFEFHGWAVIDVDNDNADWLHRLDQALRFVRRTIKKVEHGLYTFDIAEGGNGLNVHVLHGLRNHRNGDAINLYKRVAAEVPLAYGMLYVHDWESNTLDNEFQVFRMARGQVQEFADPFLSPRVPTI